MERDAKNCCGKDHGFHGSECFVTFQASRESDVYSFGVSALEIACGRKAVGLQKEENQINMVEWVRDLYGMGKLPETDFDQQEMECLMIARLWCAHPDNNLRPSMKR
ncbi:hypothetical protein RJ640_024894 [Escallonia rubra]|uniref:Serine-threonine/tyrosine-protein kinase catalytic domain-containing protein n=1 Tax=Escallonia rubra TaxID=112253 RepID=A0AA88RWD6_9ASTE|nr:hypothetical protein RJ640_024894 [Escallonia rubra]